MLKNRFSDLASRSADKGIWTYSNFLTQAEQSELNKIRFNVNVTLFGGYENAERRIAVFGSEEDIYYPAEPPVKYIKISPLAQKFADELTHRDFLGSLMALGIKRETLGDIIISDNSAYLICLENIADFIITELTSVKHTTVKCEIAGNLPETALPEPKYEEHIVASERIDVLIAAVYNLSRNLSQNMILGEKVFVNSVLTENTSFVPAECSVISVRGYGRFIFDGVLRQTKKGRDVVAVRKY